MFNKALWGWSILALSMAGCGDDGTSVPPDTGAADTSSGVMSTPCVFPATVTTSNGQIFVCHADSATECEITTSTSTTDACTDGSVPDWMFLLTADSGELQAPNWMFTGFNAGMATDGASTLTDIPDATPVSCIAIKDAVDYDLEFELDLGASSVTITNIMGPEMM